MYEERFWEEQKRKSRKSITLTSFTRSNKNIHNFPKEKKSFNSWWVPGFRRLLYCKGHYNFRAKIRLCHIMSSNSSCCSAVSRYQAFRGERGGWMTSERGFISRTAWTEMIPKRSRVHTAQCPTFIVRQWRLDNLWSCSQRGASSRQERRLQGGYDKCMMACR